MKGHGQKKGRKWEQAIAALLSEPTVEKAAGKAGVAHSTLKNRLADPVFLRAYRQARRQIVEGAVAKLQQVTVQAVVTLHRNLNCKDAAVEVREANSVLDQAFRAMDVMDLAGQVEELRASVEQLKHGDGNPLPAGEAAADAGVDPDRGGEPPAGLPAG